VLIQQPTNHLEMKSQGIELTATLAEIAQLDTRLQVQGSWIRTDRRSGAPFFGPSNRFSEFQLLETKNRAPYWRGIHEVGEKHLVTYRLIHHQPALGLAVTATIQHNLKDLKSDVGSRDTLSFAGYITRNGDLVPVPEAERSSPAYEDIRVTRGGLVEPQSAPSDWMMALQVSKTLPLDGELRFWAFNALDRVGQYGSAGRQSRLYRRVRFGVELRVAPRVILGGWE
jgi:hypothetical protein